MNALDFLHENETKSPISKEIIKTPSAIDFLHAEEPKQESLPFSARHPNIQAGIDTAKGMLFGGKEGLPEGLGYLQKPAEKAVNWLFEDLQTPEEEAEMAKNYPNFMAARHAAIKTILPGITEKVFSSEDREAFYNLPPDAQKADILGSAIGYSLFAGATKGAKPAATKLAEKFPKQFGWLIRDIRTFFKGKVGNRAWFQGLSDAEKGTIARGMKDMREEGWTDEDILGVLKERKVSKFSEFTSRKQAARTVPEGEVPAEEPMALPGEKGFVMQAGPRPTEKAINASEFLHKELPAGQGFVMQAGARPTTKALPEVETPKELPAGQGFELIKEEDVGKFVSPYKKERVTGPQNLTDAERTAKEEATLQFLDKDIVDSLTIKEVNAEKGNTVKAAIRKQLSESKPVPEKVLAEYPELKGKMEALKEGAQEVPAVAEKEKTEIHDYSSTQVNFPKKIAKELTEFGLKIPDENLYIDPKDPSYGRENTPHITVKYGLHTVEPKDVEPLLSDVPPVKATLGKISVFKGEDYDVVIVGVESPALHALNKKIADNVKVIDTHPDYKPHATIAYVKKGDGKKFIGDKTFEGKEVVFDSLVFSGKDGKKTEIKLKSKPSPIDQAKSRITDALKDQRGSFSFKQKNGPSIYDDILTVGKQIVREGHDRYSSFSKKLKEVMADVWAKIKNVAMKVFREAKAFVKREKPIPKPSVQATSEIAQKTFNQVTKDIPRFRDVHKKILDLVDVEAKWQRMASPETGFNIKNYYSQRAMHEEYGIEYAKSIGRKVNFDKKDMANIPLFYENPLEFKALPMAEQVRLGPAVKAFGKYFKDAKAEYEKLGIDIDFKKRIIEDIQDLLAKEISDADRIALESALRDAQQMNFVHIPSAMWFDGFIGMDPARGAKILKLMVQQKRKTLRIKDLIDREIIKPEDVHAADIIASYARRKGRDFAILKIANAAKKEGLATFEEKPEFVQGTGILKHYWLHPLLADHIHEMQHGRGLDLGQINKWMSLTKMAAFINPGILPMYDVVQHGMLAMFSKWPAMGLKKNLPFFHLIKGAKHYLKRSPEYYEALDNGLASKPYNNPFSSFKASLEWAKKNNREKFLEILKTVYPTRTIKNSYSASWYIAWEMDKMVRMGSYNLLREKGYSPREAAQFAAKFHSDYASVPAKVRRILNVPFFTPTFKVTMGKLYGRMIADGLKYTSKLGGLAGKIDPKTKLFAKGLLAVLVINEAWDLFMRSQGFEMDEWGRRYVKRGMDTEKGKEDLVVTWSSPSNMFLKYIYRAMDAMRPEVDRPMLKFFESNKWEIHPLWRVGYELITNDNGIGDKIVSPFDTETKKLGKQTLYAFKSIIRLVGLVDRDKSNKEAQEQFAREAGKIMNMLTYPFTFKYMRAPEERRAAWKIKAIQKQFYKELWRGKIEPQHLEAYKEKLKKVLDEFEK